LAIALVITAAVFVLLFLLRVGGARRYLLLERWPAVALAAAALFALARGMLWPALALGSLSALAWLLWPRITARASAPRASTAETPEDAEARRLLGVGLNPTHDEIRRAYRTRMAHAHPDKGGAHNEAARLTAARDRLLGKGRG
jgi:hypothetical protein